MQRSKPTAYRAFRELADPAPVAVPRPAPLPAPLQAAVPRLAPYQRCTCGLCRKCRDNARWDQIFAKFELKEREMRGMYRCALEDF
jgi:hypothetical protein